ncbi:MAG TPA: hypothetical protein VF891_03975 [Gaiellaceae bacterium]
MAERFSIAWSPVLLAALVAYIYVGAYAVIAAVVGAVLCLPFASVPRRAAFIGGLIVAVIVLVLTVLFSLPFGLD